MKKLGTLLVVLMISLMIVGTAYAVFVNRTPDATIPHSPELNQASYWGDNCFKNEGPFIDPDPSVITLGSPHSVVVLKSATNNFVWFDTVPGKYGTPTEQDVSHLIYCNAEVYEPCSVTVPGEKEFGDWYEITDQIWNDWIVDGNTRSRTGRQAFAREWTQNFYDAENPELVCSVEEGIQRRGQLLREHEEKECEIGMYLLHGYNYPCYLNQNPNHVDPVTKEPDPDTPWLLPERYDGTVYMQDLCNQVYTCDGWTENVFEWMGTWEFVCEWKPCLECE